MKIYIIPDQFTKHGVIAYKGLWNFILGRYSKELSELYSLEDTPGHARRCNILGCYVIEK